MKRLFKLAVLVAVVCVAYAVFTKRRQSSHAPAATPWSPPVVERSAPAADPEPADLDSAATEGMTEPADAPAADTPLGSGGAPLTPVYSAPSIQILEFLPAEPAQEVATDEGMPPPPETVAEDIAITSAGEPAISELAAPGAEDELAADLDMALDMALDAAADEGMTLPLQSPPEDIAVGSHGDILVSELASSDLEGEMLDAEAAFLERLAAEFEEELAADPDAAPDFAAMLDDDEPGTFDITAPGLSSPLEAPVELDEVTRAFEELAATPEEPAPPPPPAAPANEAPLLSSVEEALGDLEPAPIVPPPRRSAESYLDEGNVYFNVGQYGLAIERYGQAIELDGDLTAAFYNRANAHTRAGEFAKALSDYDRALELQPLDADALNNRGMLHLYRTNYAAALSDFNQALDIDPSDTTVLVNRGLAHLHGGNSAAALVDFREATNMDSGDAAAQYGAAQAAASLGNKDEAMRHVARALELDPGYAREAAADPRLAILAGDDEFLKLLRQSGTRSS